MSKEITKTQVFAVPYDDEPVEEFVNELNIGITHYLNIENFSEYKDVDLHEFMVQVKNLVDTYFNGLED